MAGATGKKLTFSNECNVFEVQELTKFVEDYTYERMEYFSYNGDKLNAYMMEDCKGWQSEKTLFFHMLEIIYNLEFLDKIDHADVWLVLTRRISIKFGTNAYMEYIPKNGGRYRFDRLLQRAISDYEATLKM